MKIQVIELNFSQSKRIDKIGNYWKFDKNNKITIPHPLPQTNPKSTK